jgi:hypothetical protein
VALLGCKVKNDGEGGSDEGASIGEESRSKEELAESFYFADGSFVWCWDGIVSRGVELTEGAYRSRQ